jgi:RNA polymerase sigma factor (sigma-70 family)
MKPTEGAGKVLSDAQLVRVAQEGDVASLGLLLERYRASLYGLALQILGHGWEAQDAVHDTFLVALRKIEQVRDPAAVGGWLHMVLRNVCRTRLREGQGEFLFEELPRYTQTRSPEPSPEEVVDRLWMRAWVWTALGELPEVLRVTAMLRYFGTHASYEEISAILGVPVGTVRSRLNQVKVKLAEALLSTAGLVHEEARLLTESQEHYWSAAFDEYNRKRDYEMLASTFSADPPVVLYSGGAAFCGHAFLVDHWEEDLGAGIHMPLKNVIAGKGITIIESDFENPPENPFHCPPATSLVFFYHDDKVHWMHQYYAPRPEKKGDV